LLLEDLELGVMLLLVEVVVGKLLGIDLEEGTPLGEMLALLP